MKLYNQKAVFTATQVKSLPPRDAGVTAAIVRVHTRRIDAKRVNPEKFYRRQPVTLVNEANGLKVVRFAMGGASDCTIQGMDTIAVDYDTKTELELAKDVAPEITVRPAKFPEVVGHYWGHPEMAYRLPMRLALIGLGLGLLDVGMSLGEGLFGLLMRFV